MGQQWHVAIENVNVFIYEIYLLSMSSPMILGGLQHKINENENVNTILDWINRCIVSKSL